MLLIAAVLLIFIVNENLPAQGHAREVCISVLAIAAGISVLYATLLCFAAETGWFSDIYPWAYQDIIEAVQFWT